MPRVLCGPLLAFGVAPGAAGGGVYRCITDVHSGTAVSPTVHSGAPLMPWCCVHKCSSEALMVWCCAVLCCAVLQSLAGR